MNTSIARYALGAVALVVVIGGLAIAAVAVRRRTLPDWTGAPARLAEVVIGLALLIAILEVLGTVGLFELGPIVIACALVGLAGVRELADTQVARRHSAERRGWTVATATTAVALVAGAVVLAEWGALTIQSYDVGIRGFDSLWYHLPWAASFAQTGNIVSLRFTDVEYLTPFYPATAEMLHGLGIVLLGRDTLSPGLNLVWLGLIAARGLLHRPPARSRRRHDDRRGARDGHDDDGLLAGGLGRERRGRGVLPARGGGAARDRRRAPGASAARTCGDRGGPRGRHQADRARAGARADRRGHRDRSTRKTARDRRPVARTADTRGRLLVRAQPDRGRQSAAVDELRRGPAHAGARRSSSTPGTASPTTSRPRTSGARSHSRRSLPGSGGGGGRCSRWRSSGRSCACCPRALGKKLSLC